MLHKLRKILPVPPSPIDVDDSVLEKNVKALKVTFPHDFLVYGEVYGSGTINVEVYSWEIYSPFRPSYPKIVRRFFKAYDTYRKGMETYDVPLGLFPEPGGLLPFGGRDSKYFAWKTEGSPDDWKVVVIWLYEHDGYQVFDLGFTDFLVGLLTRKIHVAGLTSKWNPKKDITFEPEVFSG